MSSDIVVVGSINMDMVVTVSRQPNWGETILGSDSFIGPGGKGGNQAYAAGKLGASVADWSAGLEVISLPISYSKTWSK